jgi:hypothetical protein
MVSLESKTTETTPTSLNTSSKEQPKSSKDGALSFAQLLKGVDTTSSISTLQTKTEILQTTQTEQTPQNNTLIQEPQSELKEDKETLLSLLQMSDTPEDEKTLTSIDNLNSTDLKKLVFDAKQYLKDQIVQSDGYKQADIKELPNTLKGLTQAAKKLDLDLSKISLEKIDPKMQQTQQLSSTTEQKGESSLKSTTDLTTKPLLQESASKEIQSHTTQQFVQTKQQKDDVKTKTTQSQNTLELLLRGEKATTNDTLSTDITLTKDFSKESAVVVAPKASTDITKDLESLLHKDSSESSTTSNDVKTNTIQTPKADDLEVKMNEAKQMVRYLSSDVKNAIDDYKSPFTRIKLQLNPQELGKVDLTIVQRGDNLHVNLSSNNSAIQTLALNANDLKTQLQNNGINNATLNFNNSAQSDSSQAQQQNHQQHRHQQQQASTEYSYFDDEVTHEEIYDSLEIVVPYYA